MGGNSLKHGHLLALNTPQDTSASVIAYFNVGSKGLGLEENLLCNLQFIADGMRLSFCHAHKWHMAGWFKKDISSRIGDFTRAIAP